MSRRDAAARLIDAPVRRVFEALVDPDALVVWLPPDGMTASFEHFDGVVGGGYRLVLTYRDAPAGGGKSSEDADVVEARFVDIVLGVRVVQTVDFVSEDPAFSGTMMMTWSVEEFQGGTRVEFVADDVPAGISAEDHAVGLASSLEHLAAYVES